MFSILNGGCLLSAREDPPRGLLKIENPLPVCWSWAIDSHLDGRDGVSRHPAV